MATQAVVISFSAQDADGDRASMPIYGLFDDATATLSSLAAWAAARASQLDAIMDVMLTSMGITIYPALPGGLKGAPNAGSDVERGALFTFGFTGLASNKSHGLEVPGFLPSKYSGDEVNLSDAAVIAFKNGLLPAYGTVIPCDPNFANGYYTLRRARKTFRKHG